MGPGDIDNRAPDAEAILNEAQRRLQERAQQKQVQTAISPQQRMWANKLNRGVFWLAHHWLAVFNVLTAFFVAGAFLPPVFLKLGMPGAAGVVYTFYRPLCHQYPFRSWFLFGPQLAYPLTTPIHATEMNTLRSFVGDAHTGYKTALCQRDVAIYGFMLLAGLVYGILRHRKPVKPWPMWQYFAFGILPMMVDGGIQWLSYAVWIFAPNLIKVPFETTPLMRAFTGALFGLGLVAASYPYLNEYFEDIHRVLKRKFDEITPSLEVTV